ncbi:hypothetical protein LIER_34678 [Lithospermum erythrorhizon]|uniref:Uncharacterized protein n=1 Tax=Lithospermum erythrorhizon TaxID=34254 RepID=A0AAV3S2I6_LITER
MLLEDMQVMIKWIKFDCHIASFPPLIIEGIKSLLDNDHIVTTLSNEEEAVLEWVDYFVKVGAHAINKNLSEAFIKRIIEANGHEPLDGFMAFNFGDEANVGRVDFRDFFWLQEVFVDSMDDRSINGGPTLMEEN